MAFLFRKISPLNTKFNLIHGTQVFVISCRKLSIVPSLYDGQDPAPKFFSSEVETLLRRLTRPDLKKVFRRRTGNQTYKALPAPIFKFLTTEELEAEMNKTERKAAKLLQMPPVVKISEHIDDVLSKDPALLGYDTAKYYFTDISPGVVKERRLIVQRDPDGTLRSCDHDTRKKLDQIYFPINGRKLREPIMFTDNERLHNLLDREEYEFVLDRACVQYDPDEPSYQRITSVVYQHVDMLSKYQLLRSTRHFGPLVFYLTWHQTIDNLMLELLQNNALREAVLLTALKQNIHGNVANPEVALDLVPQILATPVQLKHPEQVSEEDIQLDSKCAECIEKYIKSNSSMKGQQELALQGYREYYQQLIELSRGLKKAHGVSA